MLFLHFRIPELWLICPTFDLKSTALLHQRKPFLTLISRQMKWQKPPPKGMGEKKKTGFFEFLPVPFHTAFSLSPSHIWTAQCIHHLVQWTHTPFALVKFGIDFTSINKSLSISFECCDTSEKGARVQYVKVFLCHPLRFCDISELFFLTVYYFYTSTKWISPPKVAQCTVKILEECKEGAQFE